MLIKIEHTKKPQEVVYLRRHYGYALSLDKTMNNKKIVLTKDNSDGFFNTLACEFDNKEGNDTFNLAWHMDCHDSCRHWSYRCCHGKDVKNG